MAGAGADSIVKIQQGNHQPVRQSRIDRRSPQPLANQSAFAVAAHFLGEPGNGKTALLRRPGQAHGGGIDQHFLSHSQRRRRQNRRGTVVKDKLGEGVRGGHFSGTAP